MKGEQNYVDHTVQAHHYEDQKLHIKYISVQKNKINKNIMDGPPIVHTYKRRGKKQEGPKIIGSEAGGSEIKGQGPMV